MPLVLFESGFFWGPMENKEFHTLIISLLLHGLLAWLLFHANADWHLPDADKPVEINIVDENSPKMIHTAKNMDLPQDQLEKKLHEQAKLLSQLDQRVKQQMVARKHSGITENLGRGNAPVRPHQQRQSLSELNPFKQPEQRVAGMEPAERQQRRYQQDLTGSSGVGRFRAMGESSSGLSVPGVKEGTFTALNSDQLTYYSFYARVNEAIVYRWISHIRNYVTMLPPSMREQLARSPNVTRLEIILNAKGEFQQAVVHHSSGDTNLDQAALQPFKEAAPFLNPPAEMHDADGRIHLLYEFVLTLY